MKQYNLFISHSWNYDGHYKKVVDFLKQDLDFKDYSIPKDDPVHNAKNASELKEAIRRHMEPASCVLILAGVYSSYSKWIDFEIELAKQMGKKILAIEPWGSEKTSKKVKEEADKIVGWRRESIIDAIKQLCR